MELQPLTVCLVHVAFILQIQTGPQGRPRDLIRTAYHMPFWRLYNENPVKHPLLPRPLQCQTRIEGRDTLVGHRSAFGMGLMVYCVPFTQPYACEYNARNISAKFGKSFRFGSLSRRRLTITEKPQLSGGGECGEYPVTDEG